MGVFYMAKWIMVVDDDVANLKVAGNILSKHNMRVTALKSGRAMLDYINEKGCPDLILLDIKMPEMDGFEAMNRLREFERAKDLLETPVIFLTADETTGAETRGFEMGVSDYIHKPFNPDVLIRRITNVLETRNEMKSLKDEATLDKLTGFLNKSATTVKLSKKCATDTGCLLMIDLDSFKLVNDLYGHDMGDNVLVSFAKIISSLMPEGSSCGRIGGDEFVAFAKGVTDEKSVSDIAKQLNEKLLESAKSMMGEDMNIPLGASVGAIMVPKHGNDYPSLLKLADKLLYKVKKNGKHGYALYSSDFLAEEDRDNAALDIKGLSEIMGERNIPNVAMQLDMEAFSYVYRYATRYFIRNNINACKVLFNLSPSEDTTVEEFMENADEFGTHIRESLRKSDILTRSRYDQYYVLLADIREEFIGRVVNDIIEKWDASRGRGMNIAYEIEFDRNDNGLTMDKRGAFIVMVDDEESNHLLAEETLGCQGIRLKCLKSGKEFLEYIKTATRLPELILLDIVMPDMDGYQVLESLKAMGGDIARVPVIFITADDKPGNELKGLSLGAMDFIKKPIAPEVLKVRVNHILELYVFRKKYRGGNR